ncbi:MAG: signal peptide peptidase SppA [Clostridium sp.]|nr:signal peptide peptidase SppA [Clostridium sp.]
MRQFFINFMAVLAGFWISFFLAIVGFFLFVGIVASVGTSPAGSAVTSVSKHSVLRIDLNTEISERRSASDEFSSFMADGRESMPLNTLLAAIRYAETDRDIDGIVIVPSGGGGGMAQTESLVRQLRRFRESGKWIYSYGDNYTQGNYWVSSVSDSIFVNPIGSVDVHGLSSTTLYFKSLLDRLGIDIQVVKVGTFKSAVEPYLLESMSEANRLQQEVFLGRMWKRIAGEIAEARDITVAELNSAADSCAYARPLGFLLDNGLVDRAMYAHEFRDFISDLTDQEDPRYVDLADYISARDIKPFENKGRSKIAVLYATGEITDDSGDGIVGADMVPMIFDLAEEDDICGLILRVNSGGGSAFASEQIWEALERYKEKTGNPFYVSMSDYAASGGYYISCGADSIFAEPLTLTGSIGIFGMIPCAEKLMKDKIGINAETVATNPSGAYPTLYSMMTPGQRGALQQMVNNGYELFTSRVAQGRHISQDSVKMIAEGRVWDGQTALEIGLVDRLGGLDDAIASMKQLLDIEKCEIVEYPDVDFNFWREMKRSFRGIRAEFVSRELGDLAPCVEVAALLRDAAPLQCRMTPMIIE